MASTLDSYSSQTRSSCVDFFFSSRRRHTRSLCDWSSDVCSSDLMEQWQVKLEFMGLQVSEAVLDLTGMWRSIIRTATMISTSCHILVPIAKREEIEELG